MTPRPAVMDEVPGTLPAATPVTACLPATTSFDRLLINARWLLVLRWVACIGQLTSIAVAHTGLRISLPLAPLLSIVGFTALSNLGFQRWVAAREPREGAPLPAYRHHGVIAGVLALDLCLLTGLLYFSGGPSNPFAVFYFVNLALAAMILPARWAWGLTAVAVLGFVGLLVRHVPLPALLRPFDNASLLAGRTYQQVGLGVALTACAGVVIYFITRVTRELQQREQQLREAETRRARSERLEALATLAAGAGHELASPLSTIAVIAKDLARHLEGTHAPPSVIEDVALIRSELDQCRAILDSMASSAGHPTGETLQPLPVASLLQDVVQPIRRHDHIRVDVAEDAVAIAVLVPPVAMAQAIRGIVRNALDVSSFGEPVELTARRAAQGILLMVRDRGPGMTPDVLARAGDPFFTTKEPGKGMGLGLFLARNVIERIGGRLHIDSVPGTGTTVAIELPSK
ncbi:MAG: sensor histidine kinase [Pirellulaceae bacterium]